MPKIDLTNLPFSLIESVLAHFAMIPNDGRIAFQARLKNFSRLGLQVGKSQGSGRPTLYSVGDLSVLALCTELSQLGMTPDRIVKLVQRHEVDVWLAISHAAAFFAVNPDDFKTKKRRPFGRGKSTPVFIFFDPAFLQGPTFADGSLNESPLWFGTFKQILQVIDWSITRGLLVNVTGTIAQLSLGLDWDPQSGELARRLYAEAESKLAELGFARGQDS